MLTFSHICCLPSTVDQATVVPVHKVGEFLNSLGSIDTVVVAVLTHWIFPNYHQLSSSSLSPKDFNMTLLDFLTEDIAVFLSLLYL